MTKDDFSAVRKVASQNFKDFIPLYPLIKEEAINQIFSSFLKDE